MLIPFGEYLPDAPPLNNPGTDNILNVVPSSGGYRSFPEQVIASSRLNDKAIGATSVRDTDGVTYIFAGDAEFLYQMSSNTPVDVSKAGGYSTLPDDIWDFTQFNDYVIATNFTDPVQGFQLGTATEFSDLAASAPKARYCARIKDFVVLANINDGVDLRPNRVQWSPFDDPTGDWSISSTTQADYQDLNSERGWIKRIVGGEYGVVFQERAISRMQYVGDDIVFQFDEVETGRGTQSPFSVVKVGNQIFYLGHDGFYLFNGSSSIPIGAGKVNKTFLADLDDNYVDRVTAAYDAKESIIYVAYPGASNFSGYCNKMLAYSLTENRWSPIDLAENSISLLFNPFSSGYNLDELDDVLPGGIDAWNISVDTSSFTGGIIQLGAMDYNWKLSYFSGSAMDAILETKEVRFGQGVSTVFEARPIVEGFTTCTMRGRYRDGLNESYAFTDSKTPRSNNGSCHMRARGQYHRFLVNLTGDFDNAQGVDPWRIQAAGTR